MILDFEQKRKFRQFIYSKVTLVLLLFLSIYIVYSTYNVYLKKLKSQTDLYNAEKKFSDLELKNRNLDRELDSIASPYGMEKEIRSKFFVVKNDEKVVVVVDDKKDEILPVSKKSLKDKILDFFGF